MSAVSARSPPGFQLTSVHARDNHSTTSVSLRTPSSSSGLSSPTLVLSERLTWHYQLHEDELLCQPHDDVAPQCGGQYRLWEVAFPSKVNLHLRSLPCLQGGSSFAQEPTETTYLQHCFHRINVILIMVIID